MRPRKNVMLYHPNRDTAALYRYAMRVTMPVEVSVASSIAELKRPDKDIEVTVLWAKSAIEIRNRYAKTFRTLPLTSTNCELMEGVRVGLARKGMMNRRGVHKDREEKKAEVLVIRVQDVTKEIGRVERMMSLACPKRKRYAA